MTYKIKKKTGREKEMQVIRRKYKGKLPPLTVLTRTGTRRIFKFPTRTHKVGKIVNYKGKLAVVRKVTSRGVHLQEIKINKKGGLLDSKPSKKIKFIPEKEYIKANPIQTTIILQPA